MRLRPYKRCDAEKIISWINNEDVFCKWGGDHFGKYPLGADIINKKYFEDNGDCIEEDHFYPWIAFTEKVSHTRPIPLLFSQCRLVKM